LEKDSAEQAGHQALQKDAILWTEPGELDAHALAGFDVSNDALGLNFSTGTSKASFSFVPTGGGAGAQMKIPPMLSVPTREIW